MKLPYIPQRFSKSPAAVLGYEWDWSRWLADRKDSIASIVVTAEGLTVGSVTQANGIVTAVIGGGVDKAQYLVNCKIVTVGADPIGPLTQDRTFILGVRTVTA